MRLDMNLSLPMRCFNVINIISDSDFSCRLQLSMRYGSGEATVYQLSPAVLVAFFDFRGKVYLLNPNRRKNIWEINYGIQGCCEHELRNDRLQFIGKGDLSFNMESNHTCETILPMGFYKGVGIVVDIHNQAALEKIFSKAVGLDFEKMAAKFQSYGQEFFISLENGIQNFYQIPAFLCERDKIQWLRMQVESLLFYLDRCPQSQMKLKKAYEPHQVEIVKDIHEELISHLDIRLNIENMAKKHYISSTKLKIMFKEIYGKPIGTYMKYYRIRKAAQELKEGKVNISVLSRSLGYQSPSKFCAAFKEIMGTTPSSYFKKNQNASSLSRPEDGQEALDSMPLGHVHPM